MTDIGDGNVVAHEQHHRLDGVREPRWGPLAGALTFQLPSGHPHRDKHQHRCDDQEDHVLGGGEVDRQGPEVDVRPAVPAQGEQRAEIERVCIRRVMQQELADVHVLLDHHLRNRISVKSSGNHFTAGSGRHSSRSITRITIPKSA